MTERSKQLANCMGQWGVASAGCTNTILLSLDQGSMLIDTGSGVGRAFREKRQKLSSVGAIFLSHCHADHLAGFPETVFLRTVDARKLGIGDLPTLKVYGNEHVISAARSVLETCYPDRKFDVDYRTCRGGEEFSFGGANFTLTECDHTVPTNGLLIEHHGRRTGYTSDTLFHEDICEQYRSCDGMIIECFGDAQTFRSIAKSQKHLLDLDVADMVARIEPDDVVIFHLHEKYLNKEKVDELAQAIGSSVDVAGIVNESQSLAL